MAENALLVPGEAARAMLARVRAALDAGVQAKDLYAALGTTSGLTEKVFFRLLRESIAAGELPNLLVCCCGHDCARCNVFLATLYDDTALRREAQTYYAQAFGVPLREDELVCLSGHSSTMLALCVSCPWMACAREKGLSSCAVCAEHPCPPLAAYQAAYVNRANQQQGSAPAST